MKTLKIVPAVVLVLLSASLLFAAGQELAARPGETLRFDLRGGGDIDVMGWDRDTASVTTEITGRDSAQVNVDVARTASGISISTPSQHRNIKASVKIKVSVPKRYNVEIKTVGGDVSLRELEGEFSGETMGGDIVLSGLSGEADIGTMGGDISVRESQLDGSVKTMGGDVELDTVEGNLNASTMGGDVIQRNVRGRSGSGGEPVRVRSHGGNVAVDTAPLGADVHTMGGDITVQSADQFLKAKTMGGDITIKRATGEADIHTMGGDIEVDSFDGEIKAMTMGGDVSVNVDSSSAGSGHDINLDSMGGDITLRLPSNFSGRFEIELVKLRKKPERSRIETSLPLQIDEPAEWTSRSRRSDGNRYNSDYKIIRASGSIGGGDHLVRIKTISGIISIE